MTPEAAIYAFMSQFGMPAYATSSVPDQNGPLWGGFPYLTYEVVMPDMFEEGNIAVSLWFRTESEAVPNAKVREIGRAIPQRAKVPIPCDGGGILISRGSPWAQGVHVNEEDPTIRRRLLNVTVEYVISE